MFKPVLTILGIFILGLPIGANAAYTSGSVALVCPTSSYPYSAISNATMSGACTGYTGTSGGACSGSSTTRYSGFTCKSGYCKSGSSCPRVCSSSSSSSSSGGSINGCALCCTSGKPYCYNNQCYSYCPAGGSQMCPMCALRDDEFIPDASCPGGAQYSTCACGGTHTARGYTGAHACHLL